MSPKHPAFLLLSTLIALCAAAMTSHSAFGQGSRRDDVVLSASGHPIAGATIRVCQAEAAATPCNPLATVYTDATLTTTAANPFLSDGIGNYHFYAPAGRYVVQISGPGITETRTYPDVILPSDVSSSGAGNNISAFALNLGGNLTVGGNATINGTLTTANFNPGTFTPSSLSVAGNETVSGPRPRVDVTAYGAKGDNSTDDTAAIQAAINAVCAYGVAQRPTLFFPPGTYIVAQPQGGPGNTTPIFTGWCSHLLIQGSGGNAMDQFAMPSMSRIAVWHGATPGSGPVFEPTAAAGSLSAMRDINIDGYNQAVYLMGTPATDLNGFTFNNVCLETSATGYADNVPLKLSQTLQVSFQGGCIQAGSGSLDDVLIIGADFGGAEATPSGLIFFDGTGGNFWIGSGIHYDQRVNTCCSGPGNIHVRNILIEDPTQAIFRVTNSTGNPGSTAMPFFSDLDLENFQGSDGTAPSVLDFNSSGSTLLGLHMKGDGTGSNSPLGAVVMEAGALSNCDIRAGGISISLTNVVDGNGNLVGSCSEQSPSGTISVINSSNLNRLRTDRGAYADGSSLQGFTAGNLFSSLNIDPTQGLMLADGASYGYTAQVYQTAKETLDIGFASTLPPTNVAGTPTTGGSLGAGTYYYFIRSTTSSSCSATSMSAPSLGSPGVTLSGSNNAIALTWTAAPAGPGTNVGYCVFRATGNPQLYNSAAQYWSTFLAGANTTSFTDTGAGFGCCDIVPPYNAMQSVHRFTPTSLGIDTTNPQFSLDVNGSAAVNSLNSVQKAERFSGADAAAKINACLSTASTSSGLCDARGLTGQLTASSHITVPAGTTLLWGQAQLTVNDNAAKDAIELGGDGASLVGYQESGNGTVARPETSGFIACGVAGCTTVKNPNAANANVNWVHIEKMALIATGAGSKVIDLTSVGHSRIQDNYLTVGTGGGSYAIYGDTSTGDKDSTNDIIQHNWISLESQNDVCVRLAGIFNINVIEINACYMAAQNTGQEGFIYAKDSNGNYPNNSLLYGNDVEQGGSGTSFGTIGYDIQGAQDITVSNNRCEKIYGCYKFPSDGSAVGIHFIDNYLSTSNQIQVVPNEPATSEVAIDNNGHNWLPSMHFGINDLAGPNLLGNSGFEGWQSSSTLYYWGGVSGTSINQPGSSIYVQATSAGANPAADPYTQGAYNVRVGDGATAGLGVNSGCVQVDPTLEYTLMFRVASASTSNTFRPGFRFYSDANCTEANKITNIATNARVLAPANYAGQSSSLGPTGPNWQSTNASLTYNNGINCNCNVTGFDWQVATANAWTPSRNYGVTFRVPNAYSSQSTVAHSMRVFLLENTAAANNYVYFDDVVLSQGPVSPDFRTRPVPDSGNPAVYGSLSVSQHLNQGAANTFAGTVALSGGTATVTFPTPYNSAPVCTANDTSAIATVRVQTTATTLTLAQSSGTDTIMYICVGNPN